MSIARPSVTPTYLLDSVIGWRQSNTSEFILQDPVSKNLRLGETGDFAISPIEPSGTFGGQTLPTGIAIAESGFMLLADPSFNRILYYDSLTAQKVIEALANNGGLDILASSPPSPFIALWRQQSTNEVDNTHLPSDVFGNRLEAGPYDLFKPSDVAISPAGELVIADTGNQRVMIYSWPELRLRKQLTFAQGIPLAIAYDSKKRLYVVDSNNGQIYRYNSLWERDISYLGGVDILQNPIALAVATIATNGPHKEGLFVLDAMLQRVIALNEEGEAIELDTLGTEVFSSHFLHAPLSLEINPETTLKDAQLCYPQLAKPNCEKWWLAGIQLDSIGNVATTKIPLLARPRIIRLPRSGTFISEQLDGDIAASQWHRITLQADIPSAGGLLVQTFTSDRSLSETELVDVTWSQAALFTQAHIEQFFEVLIQSKKGRYLRIRIDFFGDGYTTPTLSQLQVFGHRASSLKYLPAPFKQDPESEYFLDRWLSYFDTVFDETRFLMADFTRYLSPAGVPTGDYLDWLGKWFDWTFLAQWPSDLRREMITRSMEYFKLRGTISGLRLMLQWHTGLSGDQPSIIEHYRLRDYADKQIILDTKSATEAPQALFIGEKPFNPPTNELSHWFTVVLPTSVVADQNAYNTIYAIIEAQKPAHTGFRLCIFAPGLRIGKQSSIGIDTWLGHYPTAPIGGFTLGQAAQLSSLSSPGVKIGQSVYK
jgi:phage tail-like protein